MFEFPTPFQPLALDVKAKLLLLSGKSHERQQAAAQNGRGKIRDESRVCLLGSRDVTDYDAYASALASTLPATDTPPSRGRVGVLVARDTRTRVPVLG